MKEFISAIEDIEAEDSSVDGKVPVLDENDEEMQDAEGNVILDDPHIRFKVDGRLLRSYPPNDGQLAFMLASLGRGQGDEQRFANIVNLMMATLRNQDKDYLETRLLDRDPKSRLRIKQVEAIFEHLVEEWFARPTQPASGSASSQPNAGEKSQPSTTTLDSPS